MTGTTVGILAALAIAGQSLYPEPTAAPSKPTPTSPDGLPIVLPVTGANCALEIRAENNSTDPAPIRIRFFDGMLAKIERELTEEDKHRKISDLLVQLDDAWYAQGKPSIVRISSPDNDPAKLSAPQMYFLMEANFVEAFGKAKSMILWDGDVEQERFDLSKVDLGQLEGWKSCINALRITTNAWATGPDHYRLQAPLQPLMPLNKKDWMNSIDYPSRMLRDEIGGRVSFTLEVGVNGRVRDCKLTPHDVPTIIPSENDVPELNLTTCLTIKRRARFTPATDQDGRPVVSFWSDRVRFVIPRDDPEPTE